MLLRPNFTDATWIQGNQRDLALRLERMRAFLLRSLKREHSIPEKISDGANSAVAWLVDTFGLSPFETDILVLVAAVELDSGIAALCGEINGEARRVAPTFGLALTTLPEPHWSALAPSSPLRSWRLIHVTVSEQLTRSPISIDERVLHWIAGVNVSDQQLAGFAHPIADGAIRRDPSQESQRLANLVCAEPPPLIVLNAPDLVRAREATLAATLSLGVPLFDVNIHDIPTDRIERHNLSRLMERECRFTGGVVLCSGESDAKSLTHLSTFLGDTHMPIIIGGREALNLDTSRKVVRMTIEPPKQEEQSAMWKDALGRHGVSLNGYADRLSAQFRLASSWIPAAVDEAVDAASATEEGLSEDVLQRHLWDACRNQTQPGLRDLAQRIEARHDWDDIVLPEPQKDMLRAIVTHVEQRHTVYHEWGYGSQVRGTGTSVIFAGPSGTGKTLAAEIVASALRLDLYRIDLSGIVSKYIGETEKNLKRICAAGNGAVLLFDEADALFGKRSEVRDSHDRYANIEVSYLLQQMESYEGLAILTTNMLDNFDRAFLRRVRFVVQFPFPTADQRHAIWERSFPPQAPVSQLDLNKLSRLNVSGGNIRNIALNAAFLAAGAGESINMRHLLRAASSEYAKLEKALPDLEVRDWWRHEA